MLRPKCFESAPFQGKKANKNIPRISVALSKNDAGEWAIGDPGGA